MKYLILVLCLLFSVASAETVHSVHDGDTFRLNRPQTECLMGRKAKKQQRVRFWGVDAPELTQTYGIQSRDYLKTLINGKDVQLDCTGCSFDRKICKVTMSGKNIEADLVRHGWGFDNAKFSHGAYRKEEEAAKKEKLGVWSSQNGGVRPWDYRKK